MIVLSMGVPWNKPWLWGHGVGDVGGFSYKSFEPKRPGSISMSAVQMVGKDRMHNWRLANIQQSTQTSDLNAEKGAREKKSVLFPETSERGVEPMGGALCIKFSREVALLRVPAPTC